jgi:hypothetical protein
VRADRRSPDAGVRAGVRDAALDGVFLVGVLVGVAV